MKHFDKLYRAAIGFALAGLLFSCENGPDEYRPDPVTERVTLRADDARVSLADEGASATIAYDATGGAVRLTVSTTLDWSFETDASLDAWCKVIPSGAGLQIDANRFARNGEREGAVRIIVDDKTYATITVVQQGMGADPALFIERDGLVFYDNGGNCTVSVATNQPSWRVGEILSDQGEWLEAEPAEDGKSLQLNVGFNDTKGPRSAIVVLEGCDGNEVTTTVQLTVEQWQPAMVFDIETTKANTLVALPFNGNVNLQVVWDDTQEQIETYTKRVETHSDYISYTYPEAGTYRVRVWGEAEKLSYEYNPQWESVLPASRCQSIVGIGQWGDLGFTSMRYGLTGTSIRSVPADPHGYLAGVETVYGLFNGCSQLESVPEEFFAGMSIVTDFSNLFRGCTSLRSVPANIFAANAKATSFYGTFAESGLETVDVDLFARNPEAETFFEVFYKTPLKAVPADLFSHNTKAINFGSVLAGTAISEIPEMIFAANTAAEIFYGAFAGTAVSAVPEGLFRNNPATVTVSYCFQQMTALTSVPAGLLAGLDALEDIAGLFYGCTSLRTVPSDIFAACGKVTSAKELFNGSGVRTPTEGLLDPLKSVVDFSRAFCDCGQLTELPEGLFAACTSATTFDAVLAECPNLKRVPAGLFPASTTRLYFAFQNCKGLERIEEGAFDDLTEADDMSFIFQNCTMLSEVPTKLFANCRKATNFNSVFAGCTMLSEIPAELFDAPLLVSASSLFSGCSIKTIPDDLFSTFVSATSLSSIFQNCKVLETIPENLFAACTQLKSVGSCFSGCTALTAVPAGLFAACPELSTISSLFERCTGLKNVPVSIFDNNRKIGTCMSAFGNCNAVEGESPYTEIEGYGKVHLYERGTLPEELGYTVPSGMWAFENSSFSDLDNMPSNWK